jgi:hypothetical protein
VDSTRTVGDGVWTVPAVRWCCVAVVAVVAPKQPPVSGSSRPGVGSDLPLSLLLSVRGVRGGSYGVYVHYVGEAGTPTMTKAPLLGAPNVEVVL